jgi:hypothetical protein
LRDLEREYSQRHGLSCKIDTDRLVLDWEDFVDAVVRGYDGLAEDYARDLSTRDVIEELMELASPRTKAFLRRFVDPADERFRDATLSHASWQLGSYVRLGSGWWWQREPRMRDGLQADLWVTGPQS